MNKKIKKKWISALRSGEYKKCRFNLKSSDGSYCAMGVLVDLFLKENKYSWKEDITEFYPEIKEWAGLSKIYPVTRRGQITTLNDFLELNFSEIADIIESDL